MLTGMARLPRRGLPRTLRHIVERGSERLPCFPDNGDKVTTPDPVLRLQRQYLYGPDRFRLAIEAQLGRSVGPKKIGRPRKTTESDTTDSESRL